MQVQPQNQDAYRELRGQKSGFIRTIGVVHCSFGVLLLVIGSLGIYYGAPDIPYILPLHIATGIMMFAAGICAYLAGQRTKTDDSLSTHTKCLMVTVYCLSLAGITFCFVTAGINGAMGVAFCFGEDYSRSGNIQTVNGQCTENKDRNIALSSVIIVVSVLAALFCILVTCFFRAYGRLYGITRKRTVIRLM